MLFTSHPVATTLNVLTTLSTVDLGNLDTTGFALGDDTITVTVADASGNPIPGATGTGSLLIGTPVSATLSTSPTSLPAGSGTVTATLQIASQTSYTAPLGLLGETSVADSSGVAVDGNDAYVGTSGGIDVVNISNPSSPSVVSTFGSSDFPGAASSPCRSTTASSSPWRQASGGTGPVLLIYSLATPSAPTLLGSTSLAFQGGTDSHLAGFSISNNQVYTSATWYQYYLTGYQIFAQYGETLDIDISNPAHPTVSSVIYNDPPVSSTGYPDGTSNIWQTAAVNDDVLLVGTTTATGGTVSGVQGQILVVDTSNPASPSILEKLAIPGMAAITGISVQGNQAFVIGTSDYWASAISGLTGNVVVAMLDLSNPESPTVISTQTLDVASIGMSYVQYLGNNLYVTDSVAGAMHRAGASGLRRQRPAECGRDAVRRAEQHQLEQLYCLRRLAVCRRRHEPGNLHREPGAGHSGDGAGHGPERGDSRFRVVQPRTDVDDHERRRLADALMEPGFLGRVDIADDHLARFGDRRAAGAVGHSRTRCLGAIRQQRHLRHVASSRPGRRRRADHRPQPGDPDRGPRRAGCVHRGSLEPLVERRHLYPVRAGAAGKLGRPRLDNREPAGGRNGQRAADGHLRPVRRHRRRWLRGHRQRQQRCVGIGAGLTSSSRAARAARSQFARNRGRRFRPRRPPPARALRPSTSSS